MHHKIMTAMATRETQHRLSGTVQVDDAYLGGERAGGKPGRGSENKVPFVAAISLNYDGNPLAASNLKCNTLDVVRCADAKTNLLPTTSA